MSKALAGTSGVVIVAACAWGQCVEGWLPGKSLAGPVGIFSSVPRATVWDPDGSGPKADLLVIAGNFESVGGVPAIGVAAWDGQRWQAFAPLGFVDVGVVPFVDSQGDLFVGGIFNGVSKNVARWHVGAWQSLGSGVGTSSVESFVEFQQSLVLGGGFNTAGDLIGVKGVARWDGAEWHKMGGLTTAGTFVTGLSVYGGDLIAGGTFALFGSNLLGLARWDGVAWKSFGGGYLSGQLYDIEQWNGRLVIGGELIDLDGFAPQYWCEVAAWDGRGWTELGNANSQVWGLGRFNGDLIASGWFSQINGVSASRVARFDGESWHALGSGPGGGARIFDTVQFRDQLIAVGEGNSSYPSVSAWDGQSWSPLGSGLNGHVKAFAELDGAVILAGSFNAAGTQPLNCVARLAGDGWEPLGTGLSSTVEALSTHQGELIAGGKFTSGGGQPMGRVARWDGGSWLPLGAGMNGDVRALLSDGQTLFAGGLFTTADEQPASFLARWDGAAWHALGDNALSDHVFALALFNGQVVAGGKFLTAGGLAVNRVAVWDGSAWQALGAGFDDGEVLVLAVHDGALLAGGSFKSSGGVSVGGLARWDGAAWQPLGGVTNGTSPAAVYSLLSRGSDLVVGGRFTSIGGVFANRIARWNGVTWSALDGGVSDEFASSSGERVHALADEDGTLLVGGAFTMADGVASAHFARWVCATADCASDLNRDGVIDQLDLNLLLTELDCQAACAADLDGDGLVGQSDLNIVLAGFGAACP